uniref:Endosulfine alpha n=2 Tax=Canis lupus familiaris TaxID=9615 RepID=A0A8C0S8S7_CANLF
MSQKQEEENPAEETGEEKQDTQEKEGILPERAEEAKLKAKYPSLGQKPGGSDFLMKRLQKGVWDKISYLLTLKSKGALGMRSVELLLNTYLEVLLLGSCREELETC